MFRKEFTQVIKLGWLSMQSITDSYRLDLQLALKTPTGNPLIVQLEELSLTEVDDAVTECRIACKVSPEVYQRIDTETLFNLKSDVRYQTMEDHFTTDKDIEIEVRLSDNLLSLLTEYSDSAETAAEHLSQLNQSHHLIKSPMLFSENWYALHVKQSIELPPELKGEIKSGYSTTWNNSSEDDENDTDDSIAEVMIDFFTQMQWPFDEGTSPLNQDQPIYRLISQGENGKWSCFACPREDMQQCVFYSIYPDLIPEERRTIVTEFLTRANFGMAIGNFEINLDSGEVRLKTSIDVEDDRLSLELFQQLVAANVNTMDRYLPGIQEVIEGQATPEAAIAQLEG
jgi:hypothetical protein